MNDMASAIVPKSDQLNADDLIAGPMTITITDVSIRGGQEQPVSIHFEGDNGKPYKSCKSMNRVLVMAWGADAKKYVGRSLTLYRDPEVKWGGMAVGGIRISHMSHLDEPMTMVLTATKGSRKPFKVHPLRQTDLSTNPEKEQPAAGEPGSQPDPAVACITADQCAALETKAQDGGVPLESFRKAAKVERLAQIWAENYDAANRWLDAAIAKRRAV